MTTTPQPWRIASGYTSKRGTALWRVVRTREAFIGMEEHETASGKRWLCKNVETAKRKAAELNKQEATL